MNLLERPLAITDVETTGLNAQAHEIIEIGLLVVDQKTLTVLNELDIKVKPDHIETADSKALEINGYNEFDWINAANLKDAMELYISRTKEAIFFAHNVSFDWSFIEKALEKTGFKSDMDYHRLDLFSIV